MWHRSPHTVFYICIHTKLSFTSAPSHFQRSDGSLRTQKMSHWRGMRPQRLLCFLKHQKYSTSDLHDDKTHSALVKSYSFILFLISCHRHKCWILSVFVLLCSCRPTYPMCSPSQSSHWLCSHGWCDSHARASQTQPASYSKGTALPPAGH